ncbi:15045_t:CDS:2 [Funneliformis caledonium]|uniref:15045_t:CDS:1 n=1 Tax=Funneliformis caledonium TaxID=1117310 RepID=A0A9N9DAT4_9GLOM|nr:15045_t:CDS:2 [Funneliformis caledonium]
MSFFKHSKHDITASVAEFLGTAYFIFMGVGGAVSIQTVTSQGDGTLNVLAIPFAFGFSLCVNIYIWGSVSGAALNPAVTIGLIASQNISLIRGIMYIVAQFLGGLVGAYFISLVQPKAFVNGAAINAVTDLGLGISTAQGLFLEMFTTSVLTMAVFMMAVEKPEPRKGNIMAAFVIGMSLFISAICAGPYTGASLNPARTFGPSVVAGKFGPNHWIYYVGPTLGSLLAAAFWKLLTMAKYRKATGDVAAFIENDEKDNLPTCTCGNSKPENQTKQENTLPY